VSQSAPAMAHFTTPTASDGKLFLATGQTVEAYTIANPASPISVPVPAPAPIAQLHTQAPQPRGQNPPSEEAQAR
jgi:hypothetical protein